MTGRRSQPVRLLTVGTIAAELGVPSQRVAHILRTRPHIEAHALAGNIRLFKRDAVAMIRHELHAIDARRESSRQRQKGAAHEPRLF